MKLNFAIFFLLTSFFAYASKAQTPAPPTRIAVIAFQVAVGQTNEGQRDFVDLQNKYQPKRDQLKALIDEIETLTKQLKADTGRLSESERASRANAIEEKKKQLDRDAEEAQNNYNTEMSDKYETLSKKVYEVLENYVRKQGYTIVFDVTAQQQGSPTVLYADESTNITKAVIDAYNLKSGVPAPIPPK